MGVFREGKIVNLGVKMKDFSQKNEFFIINFIIIFINYYIIYY